MLMAFLLLRGFVIKKNECTFAALKAIANFKWSCTYLAYYESIINHIKPFPPLTGKMQPSAAIKTS